MPDNDQILSEIKAELLKSLKESYGDLKGEAEQNLQNFINESESDLIWWINLLKEGKINKEELSKLIMAQKDLLKVELLKLKGFSQIEFDRIKINALQIIISIIIKIV